MGDRFKGRIPLLLLGVSFLLILFLRGIPLLTIVIRSFFCGELASGTAFVGPSNFARLLSDDVFWMSLKNTLLLLLYIPILLVLSVLMAVIMHEGIPWANVLKTIIVFPQIISTLTIAAIFSCLFGFNGPINRLIELLGLPPVYWLGNKATAISVMILCILYTMFGWQSLILSGALSAADPSVQALMRLDGLSFGRRLWIYLHEIWNTILLSVILNVVYGFSGYFPIIFTLTKGGPGYQTTTLDFLIYLRAFKYGSDLSDAYTLATLLLIIVLVFVCGLLLISRGGEDLYHEP